MEHYVTLFDGLFLPQGLALHISMERHLRAYTLWILCVDDATHNALTRLSLPNVRLLQLTLLETEDLKRVRPVRTMGEYCWTLTPFAPRFVFDANPDVGRVTYLDADMWFRKDPGEIFSEFSASGKHVLITDHAYAPEFDLYATSGQFCVQFITFTRDGGESVRMWWQERCIEWCHARFEDGKFGDQKYLDDWPTRFGATVHVLEKTELLLAPWNATRFPYSSAVLWHFHGLRLVIRSDILHGVDCGPYPLPVPTRNHVYLNYLIDLECGIHKIRTLGFRLQSQTAPSLRGWLLRLARGAWHTLWRMNRHVYLRSKTNER